MIVDTRLRRDSARTNWLMPLVMLLVGVANLRWAERLTANGGIAWDCVWYADWAKDFYRYVFVTHVSEYHVHRLLPSGLVHYGMRLFGAPLSNGSVLFAFGVLNLVLLVIGAYVWGLIADQLEIGTVGKWLGFCFLFLNYAVLKNNVYVPVLTDTSAFVLGILVFYCYLADRPLGLLAVLLAGAFTWPIVHQFAALLYVFPRRREDPLPEARPLLPKMNVAMAAIVAGGVAAALLYMMVWLRPTLPARFGPGAPRVDFAVIYLSILCTSAYLYFGIKTAADDDALFDPRRILSELHWARVGVVGVLLLAIKIVCHGLADGSPPWTNLRGFVAYTLLTSVTEPMLFFVAHVTYFGPAVLLLAFFWKPLCRSASELGIGLRLFLLLAFIGSMNSQSRYGINLVVVFFALLTRLLDRKGLKYRDVAIAALLSIAWSKVWFTMNTGPQIDDGRLETLLSQPLQRYFMNSGPWMSHDMYLVHLAALVATAATMALILFSARQRMKVMP